MFNVSRYARDVCTQRQRLDHKPIQDLLKTQETIGFKGLNKQRKRADIRHNPNYACVITYEPQLLPYTSESETRRLANERQATVLIPYVLGTIMSCIVLPRESAFRSSPKFQGI